MKNYRRVNVNSTYYTLCAKFILSKYLFGKKKKYAIDIKNIKPIYKFLS